MESVAAAARQLFLDARARGGDRGLEVRVRIPAQRAASIAAAAACGVLAEFRLLWRGIWVDMQGNNGWKVEEK